MRKEGGILVHLHFKKANMLHLQHHQTSILIGKWSKLLTWIHLTYFLPRRLKRKPLTVTSLIMLCSLQYIFIFLHFYFHFNAQISLLISTGLQVKKENPNHHPLQTHLELNQLLYVKKTTNKPKNKKARERRSSQSYKVALFPNNHLSREILRSAT